MTAMKGAFFAKDNPFGGKRRIFNCIYCCSVFLRLWVYESKLYRRAGWE